MSFLADSLHNWYIFPIAVLVASLANSSGFGGGIIFQPIFIGLMGLTPAHGVATGMLTELCGMSSGAVGYYKQRQIEFEIAFPLILFGVPGLIIGNHLLTILNPDILKIAFGVIVFVVAIWTISSAVQKKFGTRAGVAIEEVYPVFWVPFLGGVSSGVSTVSRSTTVRGWKPSSGWCRSTG